MSRAATMLAAIAAVLAALVVAELVVPVGGGESVVETTAPRTNATAAASGGAGDFVSTILARPLFRADRRPAPGDARGLSAGPGDLPRLTAILLTSEEKRAIFQPAGKERPIVVVEGETVGNWRVDQIAVDAVTLTGPGGTRRVEPKFSNSPPSGAPLQTPPAVAGPGGQPNGGLGPSGQLNGGLGPQGKR